ncbi:hypothetical protein Rsub_01735 [Raphidocelis subcapitata]|uniref:Uncharacterized protein n=1 Tax=Raphidocelis subcapitata TaxID=307507 RepID=A0A2V0NMT8_9CHLO|nr:hypothetical protein Rsub_01735 [Raphidocelis subcapitata]|eukprot:GBF88834.1 hypothetical protein Rsub_01735 [Raphidocelis subcapitata]
MAVFFRKGSPTPWLEAAGLVSAVVGLVLFLDGLRVAVMPMALLVGTKLPQRLALPWVLVVAFGLGVLVTYSEPAIAAIRPLAALVDPSAAPYLYFTMNQQQELLVFSVGAGVGVAAVVAVLKFLRGWSLKPLIAGALLPTVAAACWMHWGNPHLRPLLGVAWDCGAVTTGPVTVPVLLSLGVGVMRARKQRELARAALEAAVQRSEGNALEGFGCVTLASLLPILAVEIMAIITSLVHPYEYVLQTAQEAAEAAKTGGPPIEERSPVKEIVYGVRAICPLIGALVLLVTVVLRQPLPKARFIPGEGGEEEGDGGGEKSAGGDVERPEAAGPRPLSAVGRVPSVAAAVVATAGRADMEFYADITPPDDAGSAGGGDSSAGTSRRGSRSGGGGGGAGPADADAGAAKPAARERAAAAARRAWGGLVSYSPLLLAMAMTQVGMILFNYGLTYGFSSLGDMTGATLPASFLKVPYEAGSPYYPYAGGVAITMATIFCLGLLATRAEPALGVLGETVEALSGGRMTKRMLIWAVAIGVAVGMAAGACKILFRLPLIYFILAKYLVACALTAISRESVTAVAWDSAGRALGAGGWGFRGGRVTTGPVTVPYVLSIGIGFSTAVGAPEGFGMLTIMSVAPIISVLATSLLQRPVAAAAKGLAKVSKISVLRVSRSLQSLSTRRSSGELDFAAALRAQPELMDAAELTPEQLDPLARSPPMQAIEEQSALGAAGGSATGGKA